MLLSDDWKKIISHFRVRSLKCTLLQLIEEVISNYFHESGNPLGSITLSCDCEYSSWQKIHNMYSKCTSMDVFFLCFLVFVCVHHTSLPELQKMLKCVNNSTPSACCTWHIIPFGAGLVFKNSCVRPRILSWDSERRVKTVRLASK